MISHLISAVEENRRSIWVWLPSFEIAWMLSWGIIAGFLFWLSTSERSLIIAGIVITVLLIISCFSIFLMGGWVPLIPVISISLLVGSGIIMLRHLAFYYLNFSMSYRTSNQP